MSAAQLTSYKPDNNGVTPGKVAPEEVSPIEMNGIDDEVAVIDRTSPTKEVSETEPLDGKKKKEPVLTVGTLELFRYATCKDILFMVLGTICAMGHGAALPMMFVVFGEMLDSFVNTGTVESLVALLKTKVNLTSWNLTEAQIISDPSVLTPHAAVIYNLTNVTLPNPDALLADIMDQMTVYAYYYVGIGCGVMLLAYIQVAFWMLASEGQAHRIRQHCFRNIMHQEIGWFDTHQAGELNNRLTDDVLKIHDGIGDKAGSFIQWMTCCLTGFIVGFVYGWKLALVILAVSPVLALAAIIMTKIIAAMTSKELKAYSKAGAIAEEVLGSIRTVFAFGGQDKECARYNANLEDAKAFGIKKGMSNGLAMGFVWLVVFLAYALGFWYGSKLVRDEPLNYTAGTMMIVFFGVIIGAFSLGNASPSLAAMATAKGAAYTIFNLIERKSAIDSSSPGGQKPSDIAGNIEFRNIHFNYPSRPDVKVLDGLSLKVNIGDTVALVGSSGCGKSTVVSLLLRFYDPLEGQILVDGHDIRELNIKWFRERIGVVSQEPVLFATTIAENIKYGRDNVTQEEVVACAKMANAHNFIMELPEKYETLVGERGAQLSGGQKQRIAIARALIRDPKILLLDEATSALDTESEAAVQEALDKASQGRTTIVIAHRLSTIKTATKIAGFRDGVIVEQGTHDELMQIGGIYQVLVENQSKVVDEDDEYAEFEKQVSPQRGGSKRDLKRMLSTGSQVGLKRGTSVVEKEKEAEVEEEEEKLPVPSFRKIMATNASEWPFILLGCFACLINGGIQPAFAVIFSLIFGTFSELDLQKREREVAMFCLIFIGLGVISFLAMFVQSYMFAMSGELMTLRLRNMTFKAMLRQEVGWFDDHKNSTGALTTRLATDASKVQGATGIQLGVMIQSVANMGTGIVIAFVYGWKLALLILAFVPFIIVAGALQMKILQGGAAKNKEALEEAGKIAAESIENIRTVSLLVKEDKFCELFGKNLEKPYAESKKKAHLVGFSFSFSQAIIFYAYAAAFTFGAYLIKQGEMDFENVFKVFSAIVFCAMGLGQASSFAPDAAKAKISAARIFALNERVPEIDSYSNEGEKPSVGQFSSKVEFKDVRFFYPTRPTVEVLRSLNLTVNPGETLALVGSSGCGKSTTVQLIQRFYDPAEGSVILDRYDSKSLNVKWLREQMGIVSQEPVLFDCSIAENIAYGDNTRVVSMDEVISAARSANIHGFIASLPNSYETVCGDKGTQLSGGQKQRVAIARALVRNPRILLLDEATSALDTESEKLVQVALDKAREGRTCIVIAHRLSTIQNADKIAVIHNGQVVEQGRHSDLLSKQGFYYRLNMAQLSQKS